MSIEFFIFPPEWRQRTIIMLTHVGGSQYFCSRYVHQCFSSCFVLVCTSVPQMFHNCSNSGTKREQMWDKLT